MKVGVDLDGVICDTMHPTLKFLNRKYDFNFTMSNIVRYKFEEWIPGWTREDSRKLFLKKPLYKNSLVIKDSLESIRTLLDNNFEIEFLTVRDLSLTEVTFSWLDKNGFGNIPTWFFRSGDKKIEYIKNNHFDIIVEDNLDYLIPLNDRYGVFYLYLIDYPYNQNSPKGITRVKGWKEIIDDLRLWDFVK